MKRKQFVRYVDAHIREMMKLGEIVNQADIVAEIQCFKGVKSVKAGKAFVSVTLDNEKETTHRLRGDLYCENFELGAYAERLRQAATGHRPDSELAEAIGEAEELLELSRAKRAAYHAKHHPSKQGRNQDHSYRVDSKLDFDRNRELESQDLKEEKASFLAQLDAIQKIISNTDLSKIQEVSVSVQALQAKIDQAISSISIDQKQVQALVKQAIENQAEFTQTEIQSLLQSQAAKHTTWGVTVFGVLMLLMSLYTTYLSSTNLKTISAQKEMIQQNSQSIQSQINYLNTLRR
ncbi:hypothetical protein AB3538_18180 [Acinetobacter baumannii]